MESLKNDQLTIEISEHGAELHSIRDSKGHEYLWQGDAQYWGRRSPVLFPWVCSVWHDTFRVNGKEYHNKKHGFARDSDFRVIARGDNQVVFAMHDTKETYEKYPFHFNLGISYKLDGNRIRIVWHVENTDDKPIYFQIGGHPAFNVPGAVAGQPLEADLQLDADDPVRVFCTIDGCIDRGRHEAIHTEKGLWHVTEDTFKEDSVQFDHSQVHHITLLDKEHKPYVSVDFKTPAVAVWTPWGKHAPFLCIEPWYGIADFAHYEGEFKDRYLMNKLLPGSSFMSEYTITIGE
ncbi:aldose epimerase family protein [Prevotella sp. CAG:924]|nr:aldose epimerase family protein [Prevotella sp. CAG:924]